MARRVVLVTAVPEGAPQPKHFEVQKAALPVLGDGVLVELLALSADPYMRRLLKTGGSRTLTGNVAGRVIESAVPDWQAGDLFRAHLPYIDVQAIGATALTDAQMCKLTGLVEPNQISHGIGAMGLTGATAYGGLIDVLRPSAGETIWISGACGAVGSLVGQIAKNVFGCKVIGSAGGAQKCDYVRNTFGFDHCVDYKSCSNAAKLRVALRKVAPNGIDMYFENVGGMHFEAAMHCLNVGGRVAVCGTISNYNERRRTPEADKITISNMIYTRQRVEGFEATPWLNGTKGNFLNDMSGWIKEGKVKVKETFFDGMDSYGDGMQSLFTGGNYGKVVVTTGRSITKQ